jgi:hypothetical protein
VGIALVKELRPCKFKWNLRGSNVDNGRKTVGFLAQEVEDVLKKFDADAYATDLVTYNEDEDQYSMSKELLIPFMVKAIQELSAKVAELEAKLDAL